MFSAAVLECLFGFHSLPTAYFGVSFGDMNRVCVMCEQGCSNVCIYVLLGNLQSFHQPPWMTQDYIPFSPP
jgi:hypothetical protein